jgi:hypothetical protein
MDFQIGKRDVKDSWKKYGVTPCNKYWLISPCVTLSLSIIHPSEYVHYDATTLLNAALVNFVKPIYLSSLDKDASG